MAHDTPAQDPIGPEVTRDIRDEISPILHLLNEARIKYAVWGAAACVHHGGWWLWKCLDYEILIQDWFEGPKLRRAIDLITTHCSEQWEYDHRFDVDKWAQSRGDRPPDRPIRRFRHKTPPRQSRNGVAIDFGILLFPSDSMPVASMHHDDLVNEEDDPVWIYPSLKNLVESQFKLWSLGGRNSALVEVFDLAQSKAVSRRWGEDVGLVLWAERRPRALHLPSEREVWEEILRMALTRANPVRATARFREKRAAKAARRDGIVVNDDDDDDAAGESGDTDAGEREVDVDMQSDERA